MCWRRDISHLERRGPLTLRRMREPPGGVLGAHITNQLEGVQDTDQARSDERQVLRRAVDQRALRTAHGASFHRFTCAALHHTHLLERGQPVLRMRVVDSSTVVFARPESRRADHSMRQRNTARLTNARAESQVPKEPRCAAGTQRVGHVRVARGAVALTNLEMQMWAGGSSRHPHGGDGRSLSHALPALREQRTVVAVLGDEPVCVQHLHVVAQCATRARKRHRARGCRQYKGALSGREIEPSVELDAAPNPFA